MNTVYDIIGIGIGPFNLGMAAMCEKLPLNCLFFDENPEFNWHPGMMLPNARIQVPFYADLVTVVDPTSKYTFLNYLREKQRLFKFAIHENNFITRREYNDYCRWVVEDLQTLRFNHHVIEVKYESITSTYVVTVLNKASDTTETYYAKHIVVGIGSVPWVPECVASLLTTRSFYGDCFAEARNDVLREPQHDKAGNDVPIVFHSSQYLYCKKHILPGKRVTVVGSGQSAAEIFADLLNESEELEQLNWFSRSERFYPMEYSKLSLEMTSTDYIDHFYSLSTTTKAEVLKKQGMLYKGINFGMINEIYDALYIKDLNCTCENITIQSNVELVAAAQEHDDLELVLEQTELREVFTLHTHVLILATGYQQANPAFLNGVIDRIGFDELGQYLVNRNYSIDNGNSLFVQNVELHTHGFSAPDLGMGPYRNATILNSILGYEHYQLERKVAFQGFGGSGAVCQRTR